MITFYLSIPYSMYTEVKEFLYLDGYHFSWDEPELLMVDEDEAEDVKAVLRDRGIGYQEG